METRNISVLQATFIIASTITGVGILALPRFAVVAAGTGAPLLTILGAILATTGLIVLTQLGRRFPNQTILGYSQAIISLWPSRLFNVAIILFFALLTALTAREFGEVIVSVVLRRTPLEVSIIVMLFLALGSARKDMAALSNIHTYYLPFILAPAVIIIVFSLRNIELINLQPILGNGPHQWISGTFLIAALFQGSFIMTLIIPKMIKPGLALKSSLGGLLIVGSLYLFIVISTLGVFGTEEIKLLIWPTLENARTTSIPGLPLERLDAIFLIVWVISVFTTLYSTYFITSYSFAHLLGYRDHRIFAAFLLPFVFLMAMIPSDILDMYLLIEWVGKLGLILTVIYPILLFLIAKIRRIRGS